MDGSARGESHARSLDWSEAVRMLVHFTVTVWLACDLLELVSLDTVLWSSSSNHLHSDRSHAHGDGVLQFIFGSRETNYPLSGFPWVSLCDVLCCVNSDLSVSYVYVNSAYRVTGQCYSGFMVWGLGLGS